VQACVFLGESLEAHREGGENTGDSGLVLLGLSQVTPSEGTAAEVL
jgi:hypothetical protein